MTALPHPAEEPVDRRSATRTSDWSGYTPSPVPNDERRRRLAAAWFEPLWEVRSGEAVVHGWRFTCPFCGQKRESGHYTETYGYAYRHLLVCEWTDRFGLGSSAPF